AAHASESVFCSKPTVVIGARGACRAITRLRLRCARSRPACGRLWTWIASVHVRREQGLHRRRRAERPDVLTRKARIASKDAPAVHADNGEGRGGGLRFTALGK